MACSKHPQRARRNEAPDPTQRTPYRSLVGDSGYRCDPARHRDARGGTAQPAGEGHKSRDQSDPHLGQQGRSTSLCPNDEPGTGDLAKQCADRIGRVFPVKQDLLSRAWDSARETMGITDDHQFIPHACRHTCASRLVQAGVDLYTVQRFLGHSTIRVTERYAHLSPLMLQTAAQALEKQKIGVIFGDAERNSSPRR